MRYAARRDNNEASLSGLARRLGWWLIKTDYPTDFIGLRSGVWHLIEIKNPKKRGHEDEFTEAQKRFRKLLERYGGKTLVWRTDDDVLRDSGTTACELLELVRGRS